jgi:hypothetical protein
MYSAFGVDHGGISKGLPSALKNADKFASGAHSFSNTRIAANTMGRAASGPTSGNALHGAKMRNKSRGFLKPASNAGGRRLP